MDERNIGFAAHHGIAMVFCESSEGGDGVVPGDDPSDIGGRAITIEVDPDPEKAVGTRETLVISGPNDPDVLAAIKKYSDPKTRGRMTPADITEAVYRDAARAKSARGDGYRPTSPIPATGIDYGDIPVINTGRPDDPAIPPGGKMMSSRPPVTKPSVMVHFDLGDGGSMSVGYDDVVVSGDTLALVSSEASLRSGTYTPPKSTSAAMRPIVMRIDGMNRPDEQPVVIVAYRFMDPYTTGPEGYTSRHVVLMIDRDESR